MARGSAPLEVAPGVRAARRLGIYGGSFDPPHAGHLWVAERARAAFDLDHVVFVPARHPPHKPGRRLAPDGDRLILLALCLAGYPWASTWAGELRREGPSYTVDSVERLARELGPGVALHLILGSDNLAGLPGWHRAHDILALVQPIVVPRAGAPFDPALLGDLSPDERRRVEAGFLPVAPFDADATALRAALARGEDPGPLLPAPAREYARLRGIYTARA